jgi:hypothetical protein
MSDKDLETTPDLLTREQASLELKKLALGWLTSESSFHLKPREINQMLPQDLTIKQFHVICNDCQIWVIKPCLDLSDMMKKYPSFSLSFHSLETLCKACSMKRNELSKAG